MFGALLKAFTGRAGFLASLLALSLIAVTAAAVVLSLPRIEQQLFMSSQSVLSDNLAEGDVVESIQPMGRTILVQGQFQDEAQLAASLQAVTGVRKVVINGPAQEAESAVQEADQPTQLGMQAEEPQEVDAVPADDSQAVDDSVAAEPELLESDPVMDAQADATAEIVAVDEQEAAAEVAVEEIPAQVIKAVVDLVVDPELPIAMMESAEPEIDTTESQQIQAAVDAQEGAAVEPEYDQSMLSLRYDGARLQLSGHLADEQMAELIAEEVRNAIPRGSELEISVDGSGKGSTLNWMNKFLAVVTGLPDDAQGVIEGSDREGVRILPDEEQTLRRLDQEQIEADRSSDQDAPPVADTEEIGAEQSTASVSAADTVLEAVEDVAVQAHVNEADTSGGSEQLAEEPLAAEQQIHPGQYIVELNRRLNGQELFETGEFSIGDELSGELDALVTILQQNPEMLLRVVGNLDFTVEPRFAEFVGIDRAREIRDYLHEKGVEPYRVFATPLPREYAYDKRVQVVFYISE